MLLPTKHQKLNENLISIGAEILIDLKRKDMFIEDLFSEFKSKYKTLHLDNFFLTLIFLWLVDAIKIENSIVKIKK